MKKTALCMGLGVLLVFGTAVEAHAWGSATHAYIANCIGKWLGLKNSNEMYGAMAADLFNYDFSLEGAQYLCLRGFTHGIPGVSEDFMQVWFLAGDGLVKSGAYGFISHNNVWGADSTAHIHGCTYGQDAGWVIQKARDMVPYLQEAWDSLGLIWYDPVGYPDQYEICEDICHEILELAGDLVLKRYVPQIGVKVTASAALRDSALQDLLVTAFGSCAGEAYVRAWESEFRNLMIMYGYGLQLSEQEAVEAFAAQLADLASGYLAQMGVPVPPYEYVYDLSLGGLQVAIGLIEQDYMKEIHATIWKVRWQMLRHWVVYW